MKGEARAMYVYIQSEPNLWTVGFYDPQGKRQSESDHDIKDNAASRVNWLNGEGGKTIIDEDVVDTTKDVMVKIDGKSFRCKCGCNVFRYQGQGSNRKGQDDDTTQKMFEALEAVRNYGSHGELDGGYSVSTLVENALKQFQGTAHENPTTPETHRDSQTCS